MRCLVLAGLLPALAAPAFAQPRLAAEACLGCHGPAGQGGAGAAAIAGREPAAMIATLEAFRAGQRPGTIMGRIMRGYTPAEIAALAEHFAELR